MKELVLNRAAKVEDIREAVFTDNQKTRIQNDQSNVRFIPGLTYIAPAQRPVGVKLGKPFTSGKVTYTHSNHIHLFGVNENGELMDIVHVSVNSFGKVFFNDSVVEVKTDNGKQSFPNKEKFIRTYSEGSLPLAIMNGKVVLRFALAFKISKVLGFVPTLEEVGTKWLFKTKLLDKKPVLDMKQSNLTVYEEVQVPDHEELDIPDHLKEYFAF